MPQPFQHFNMADLKNWTQQIFKSEAKKQGLNDKIGDLAHFLVTNFPSECSPTEHVIDTAIRLLTPKSNN